MIKYMLKIAGIGLLVSIFLFSCKNDDFRIGTYLSEPYTKAVMVDTLSVKLSIIAVDSVITAQTGKAYAGRYHDPYLGTSTARTFMEFNRTNDIERDKYAKFDSVTLVLFPFGIYYGDTVQHAAMKISRLVKPMQFQSDFGEMYSTSSVPVGDMVKDMTFRVRAAKKRKIELRLPDEFGEKLFWGIVNDDDDMKSDNFLKTFPGLALEPSDISPNPCIYGFVVADSACQIKIYYHKTVIHRVDTAMKFKVNNMKQFNQYITQRPDYLQITSKDQPKPTELTRNMGIVQSGPVLYTQIEFPTLNQLLNWGEIVTIESAQLIIRPVRHSYDTVPLPPALNLYQHNPLSDKGFGSETLLTDGKTIMTGNLNNDYRDQPDKYYYSYNITDFISGQLGAEGYNKWSLRIAIPDRDQNGYPVHNEFQRMVFGDQHFFYKSGPESKGNQVMLRVTYSIYNQY